ncbi:hypothetical protein PR048_022924 [Dryococelus australis]|uniref:Uncharacterized protein n=1 Tax=Dryococelus australis TaxID=614101 RepID=A0ABQ9GSQ5_9NEOP|nr:hypothetical protein PR048_022924 [Dryococelus australis]
MELRRNEMLGETGDPRGNLPDKWHRPALFSQAKIRERLPSGIGPGSSRWETMRLARALVAITKQQPAPPRWLPATRRPSDYCRVQVWRLCVVNLTSAHRRKARRYVGGTTLEWRRGRKRDYPEKIPTARYYQDEHSSSNTPAKKQVAPRYYQNEHSSSNTPAKKQGGPRYYQDEHSPSNTPAKKQVALDTTRMNTHPVTHLQRNRYYQDEHSSSNTPAKKQGGPRYYQDEHSSSNTPAKKQVALDTTRMNTHPVTRLQRNRWPLDTTRMNTHPVTPCKETGGPRYYQDEHSASNTPAKKQVALDTTRMNTHPVNTPVKKQVALDTTRMNTHPVTHLQRNRYYQDEHSSSNTPAKKQVALDTTRMNTRPVTHLQRNRYYQDEHSSSNTPAKKQVAPRYYQNEHSSSNTPAKKQGGPRYYQDEHSPSNTPAKKQVALDTTRMNTHPVTHLQRNRYYQDEHSSSNTPAKKQGGPRYYQDEHSPSNTPAKKQVALDTTRMNTRPVTHLQRNRAQLAKGAEGPGYDRNATGGPRHADIDSLQFPVPQRRPFWIPARRAEMLTQLFPHTCSNDTIQVQKRLGNTYRLQLLRRSRLATTALDFNKLVPLRIKVLFYICDASGYSRANGSYSSAIDFFGSGTSSAIDFFRHEVDSVIDLFGWATYSSSIGITTQANSVKTSMHVLLYTKPEPNQDEHCRRAFKTLHVPLFNVYDIDRSVDNIKKICCEEEEMTMMKGSGWTLDSVDHLHLEVKQALVLRTPLAHASKMASASSGVSERRPPISAMVTCLSSGRMRPIESLPLSAAAGREPLSSITIGRCAIHYTTATASVYISVLTDCFVHPSSHLGSVAPSWFETRSEIGSKIDQKTVAPFEFRAGLEIEIKLISNRRNWRFEISIRDQQPSTMKFRWCNTYIGTKIKLDHVSELGSFDLGLGRCWCNRPLAVETILKRCSRRTVTPFNFYISTWSVRRATVSDELAVVRRCLPRYGEPDPSDAWAKAKSRSRELNSNSNISGER